VLANRSLDHWIQNLVKFGVDPCEIISLVA
jgi:hypothetical protein